MRDFDFVSFEHDVLVGLGGWFYDVLSSLPTTVLGGLVATQTGTASLSINVAAGRIYQFAPSDSTADGSIAQDLAVIVQQGYAPAQTITLTAPSSGQSQWSLIQAQFSQVDAVRTSDPNSGIVPFYNVANPTQPTSNSVNTVRKGVCVLQVITGSAATTGSQTPPSPTSGWVPLYLISLAGGQTQITNSQILVAGPSVGTGVSSTYPYAPFLAGFLASHHSGTLGQAPKIKLASEVQGILPYANMSPVRTLLNAALTLYVNNSTGVDTNTGLTPSVPFKTIQAAVNSIYHNYDFNGFGATVSVANGTYTAGASLTSTPVGMSLPITIIGNTASPASCTVTVATANCFQANIGAQLNVSGFALSATGSGSIGYGFVASLGFIAFGAMSFGACASGHMWAVDSGAISLSPSLGLNYSITGGGIAHIVTDTAGAVNTNSSVVTLTGTPAFSTAFVFAVRASAIQSAGATFSGTATGPKYSAQTGASINTQTANVNFYPGSTAGSSTTGYYS